jgi:hypothetical protein
MKFAETPPLADPKAAVRQPVEIANLVERVQDGRVDSPISAQ